MHRSALALVVTLPLLAWPASRSAHATPPPASAIIAAAGRALPERPGWAQATYVEVASDGAPARSALRISVSPAGLVREDQQELGPLGRTATRVWGPAPGARAPSTPGSPEPPPALRPLTTAPAWLQLLAGRPVADVARDMGVDLGRTAFGRDGSTLLWVVGAGPQEPNAPQLHVEAASGVLRQVVERPRGDAGGVPGEARALVVRFGAPPPPAQPAPGGQASGLEAPPSHWPPRLSFANDGGAPITLELRRLLVGEPLEPRLFTEPLPPGPPLEPARATPRDDGGAPLDL